MPKVLRHALFALAIGWIGLCPGLWNGSACADDSTYNSAAQHYRQGDWREAANLFADCLADEKQSEQHGTAARFYQAECQMQLGDYAAAREIYLEVLSAVEKYFEARALFRAGEAAWLSGHAAEAQVALQRFVREHPHDRSAAYAFTYLGDLALKASDANRAAAAYRVVIDSYAHSSRVALARLGLAKSLLMLNWADQVPVALGRVKEHSDQAVAAEACLLLGRAAYDTGQFEHGLTQFRDVCSRFPESPLAKRARLAAAWSLWRLGRFDEISQEVEPLCHETEWVADYHYLLGMAAYGNQDWQQGSQQLAAAIAAGLEHPNLSAMLFYHGECCFQDSRFDDARRLFEQVAATHSQSAWLDDALWGLARVARAENDSAAYQAAALKLRRRASTSEYVAQLNSVESRSGSSKSSIEAEKILDEAAGLQRDGRHDSALATYHQLIDRQQASPIHAEALRRGARLHQLLNQYREAQPLWEQLLSESPDSRYAPEAIAALAQIHDGSGEPAEAKSRREELLAKFSQSAQASEAAYRLARVAADEDDSDLATQYGTWLLDELESREDLTEQQRQLWVRAVSLLCHLAAAEKRWQVVEDIAAIALPQMPQGTDRVRVEFWLAEAEFRTGRFNEARLRLAELDPRTVGISENWVAMVPLRRAQLAARRQQWTEVLKLVDRIDLEHLDFPLHYEVDYLRGRALAGRGEMSAAREAYRRVLASAAGGDSETIVIAQWMIGETFFHQRDYSRARKAYLAVIERQAPADWQSRAALQVGKCWELEDQWDKAQAMYQQALRRWPGAEPETQIQTRLKWTQSRANSRR
jgi:TolA-binding protein